jgi:uncharacterized membrane protein
MKRSASFLLMLSVLFVLLATPVVGQDDATAAPAASPDQAFTAEPEPTAEPALTQPPLPTAIPSSTGAVVQGVFFFSPTCGHCEYVISQILPALFADNGGSPIVTFDQSVLPEQPAYYLMSNGRLQLLLVDASQPDGGAMFQSDSVRLKLDRAGVPRLDIKDIYLVGSGDIPDQFPGIVEDGLAGDGITWPPVPGIEAALVPFIEEGSVIDPTVGATSEPAKASPEPAGASVEPVAATTEPAAAATTTPKDGDEHGAVSLLPIEPDQSALDKIGNDPVGNGISIVVLIGLVLSLIAAPYLAVKGSLPGFPSWLVIVLTVVGIAVAAYLANIETTGDEAVCGPVGDCNAVQESQYAKLFGIPIGVLGVIGYLVIGGLWVISRVAKGSLADWALVLITAAAFAGTFFSAYLTFLEPFVIGATCMWCITSALVMVALLWVSAGPGWAAWQRLRGGPSEAETSTT